MQKTLFKKNTFLFYIMPFLFKKTLLVFQGHRFFLALYIVAGRHRRKR
jgi:hypothetical protein